MKTITDSMKATQIISYPVLPVFCLTMILLFSMQATGNSQEVNEPEGWSLSADRISFKAGIDTMISQHGKSSATIESVSESPESFSTLMQSFMIREFSGKRVKMTGYIKSRGTDVIATMWARVDDIGNRITADFDNMIDRPVSGNSDWTKCEIILDVPEKCAVFYGFIIMGEGKIWVDNVSFETVSNTVSKTAQFLNQPLPDEYFDQLKEYKDGLPEKPPVNLDFEDIKRTKELGAVRGDLTDNYLHVHLLCAGPKIADRN